MLHLLNYVKYILAYILSLSFLINTDLLIFLMLETRQKDSNNFLFDFWKLFWFKSACFSRYGVVKN